MRFNFSIARPEFRDCIIIQSVRIVFLCRKPTRPVVFPVDCSKTVVLVLFVFVATHCMFFFVFCRVVVCGVSLALNCNHLVWEEGAGCFVFLCFCGLCTVCLGLFAFPLDVIGRLFCDCGSTWTFSFLFFTLRKHA